MTTNTIAPASLAVDHGDTVYIHGEKTIVKSNRWMGNHKWISATRGAPGFIRKAWAQEFMNEGKAKFYAN
jgi:hypothetical protein